MDVNLSQSRIIKRLGLHRTVRLGWHCIICTVAQMAMLEVTLEYIDVWTGDLP
jgi:hypothetical protein